MPSFSDSIFIFMLALMLFGPKKLPQLARQLGKLMAEFRRASNEFRMQMDDELRIEEQKEHQTKIAALAGPPSSEIPTEDPPHPHMPAAPAGLIEDPPPASRPDFPLDAQEPAPPERRTVIAESGELKMMPPSTGLPVSHRAGNGTMPAQPQLPTVPEHSILPEAAGASAGISSEEPAMERGTGHADHTGNSFAGEEEHANVGESLHHA